MLFCTQHLGQSYDSLGTTRLQSPVASPAVGGGATRTSSFHTSDDVRLRLIFDPILKYGANVLSLRGLLLRVPYTSVLRLCCAGRCYFDPVANKYYELKDASEPLRK